MLAFALPFESIRPVLALEPWFSVTNLQLILGLTAAIWVVHWFGAGSRPAVDTPLTRPALLFLGCALASALLAPAYQLEALKFVGRLGMGLFACLLIVQVASTSSRVTGLLWAVVLGAGLSVLVGLGEMVGGRSLDPLLSLFKDAPTRVGGELRVSGSFQYATIAAMFFEMVVPLALALAATTRNRTARGVGLLVALGGATIVHLSLTRTGMVTVVVVLGLMLAMAWQRPSWRALRGPAAFALVGFLVVGVLISDAAVLHARFTAQGDQEWYGAAYAAPASLSLSPGRPLVTPVEVRNTGEGVWRSQGEHAVALGYYWLDAEGENVLLVPRGTVDLPHDVAPGETVRLMAEVNANLPGGEYRLAWGMLQQNLVWFRHRGIPEADTLVRVEAAPGEPVVPDAPLETTLRDEAPERVPTLPRAELWRAAFQMFAERPLLGVGPDNFRRLHGGYLGLSSWDERIYANNLYLELLATLGVAGAVAFGWLLMAAGRQAFRLLRTPIGGPGELWTVGLGASLLAFLLHGILDYFLWTTSVSLLFWMVLGLTVAVARLRSV